MNSPLLRWLGSLLVGSLLCYFTWLLTSLALQFAVPGPMDVAASGLRRLFADVIPHAAGGAVFVFVADRLAPQHPQKPAVALLAFVLILTALVVTGVLAFPTGRLWVGAGAALLGAGATAALLWRGATPRT
jgi:hypothetical protein